MKGKERFEVSENDCETGGKYWFQVADNTRLTSETTGVDVYVDISVYGAPQALVKAEAERIAKLLNEESIVSGNAEDQLDPGIADVVVMLRNLGFHPTDSGDGRSKPDEERDFDVKHVACTVLPQERNTAVDEAHFIAEANRLQQVLGDGWRVEASFSPCDCTFILLATKNEEPGPRHSAALNGWPFELAHYALEFGSDSPIKKLYDSGCALHKALQHELGRR